MLDFMSITKALADENRVRILAALNERELCVCQVIDFLQLAPSTVSKHLSILRQARLVSGRKEGRWMYYRLAEDSSATPMVAGAIKWTLQSVQQEPAVCADQDRLSALLANEPVGRCAP